MLMMAANRRGLARITLNTTNSEANTLSAAHVAHTSDSSGPRFGLTNPTSRSIPSILSRKRKSDVLEENMDFSVEMLPRSSMGSENCPPPAKLALQNPGAASSVLSSSSTSSSRVPLSTLQNSSNLNFGSSGPKPSDSNSSSSNNNLSRIPPRPLPKFKPEKPNTSPIHTAKKLVLRSSWSEFREFIRTSSENRSRSKTPFPSLKWADQQTMWDLICKKESGMYQRNGVEEFLARHQTLQARMRAILLDWLLEVCEVYKLHRETFYLAVDFVDRYLSKTENMPKNRLQLVGVTCLFIGAKIEEIYPPKLSEFAYVTDGACTEKEILGMELVVLQELNWGLSPMTPHGWMKMFMQVINCDNSSTASENFVIPQFSGVPFTRAMQLLDACILDLNSLSFRYSVIAATALSFLQTREIALAVSGYQWEDLAACHHWMYAFVRALRVESPVHQPKVFSSINLDNQHNIQTHSVQFSVMNKALDILSTMELGPSTPIPRRTESVVFSSSVGMTPPSSEKDIKRLESPVTPTVSSSTSVLFRQQVLPSVFMTPDTPNAMHIDQPKHTINYPQH
eukprot:maker-scaffold119_size336447-snap-gene-2.30 protein:Tk11784 transcript:maker-scaffold119_size336447-snap-gene-2.30-mRNA-1 annotation:"g1 s-specific cyclin-e"